MATEHHTVVKPRQQYIYFVQIGTDGPIKIGLAWDTWRRIIKLQVGCPWELCFLNTQIGDRSMEKQFHRRFKHLRMRGEWFHPGPDLLSFIKTLHMKEEAMTVEEEEWARAKAISLESQRCRARAKQEQ